MTAGAVVRRQARTVRRTVIAAERRLLQALETFVDAAAVAGEVVAMLVRLLHQRPSLIAVDYPPSTAMTR